MNKKLPICVCLVGAPGAGKSTLAAAIFAKMKMKGINCELVSEFAKDKMWELNKTALANQVYVFAKQYFRQDRCCGKVDVLVTDSPLILSPLYNRDKDIEKPLRDLVFSINNKYKNLYFFIERVVKYNPIGRKETEEESDSLSEKLKGMLKDFNINYTTIPGNIESVDYVIDKVLEKLNENNH